MKKFAIYIFALALTGLAAAGCSDFLDFPPKGVKTPATIAEFRAFLESYNNVTSGGDKDRSYICNEIWINPNEIHYNELNRINFLWDETGDRINNQTDQWTYLYLYKTIFYMNTVVNEVSALSHSSEAEALEAKELIAQARMLRALFYFIAVNNYAKAYNPTTAATDMGIPYTLVANDFETPIKQRTVGEVYGFILDDLNAAIPDLPEKSIDFLLPNKAAGYGMRARVHQFMQNFDLAMQDVEKTLSRRSFIFDMVAYHDEYVPSPIQDDMSAFGGLPQFGYTLAIDESILVVVGGGNYYTSFPIQDPPGNVNCTRDLSRFEEGDTRFLINYYRDEFSGCYSFRRYDDHNNGGLRTTEMFLIRAECYARQNMLTEAMADVNRIREKRILSSVYAPLTASTVAEAMTHIRHERDVELMGSDMMFYDLKRLNTEEAYKLTLIKTDHNGVRRTLTPDSDLWILPFPTNVIEYNKGITQNTSI